jgi:hypothetical protein
MLSKVIGGVILTSRDEVVKIRPELNGLIVEREQILKFKKYCLCFVLYLFPTVFKIVLIVISANLV